MTRLLQSKKGEVMPKIPIFRNKSFQIMFLLTLLVGIVMAFAVDTDNDGMSDVYENFFKLNPTNDTDAAENYDTDTLNNLQESQIWTDPDISDTDADGFADDIDANPLSRAVIRWGDSGFTAGDEYLYTGPSWWMGAGKLGGEWGSNGNWRVSPFQSGSLYIDFDRSLLTNNLMLDLRYLDVSNGVVRLDLLDADSALVASNLYGNLLSGSGEPVYNRYAIPFAGFPAASRLLLSVEAGAEAYEAYSSVFSIDDDADGLDADQELQIGTSDQNPDCDADTLTDYAEVMTSSTDPLMADSDGDGLSDAQERDMAYFLTGMTMSWAEAKVHAEQLGGHLAVITSEAEQNTVVASIPGLSVARPWIGATDGAEEGVWVWVTGESFDYTCWGVDQPNNTGDHMRFRTDLDWRDANGKRSAGSLVEFETSLDPLNPDTDGDGLSDGDEVNLYGTCAQAADTDLDGLTDSEELAQGTDPLLADMDGDGLTDPEELALGTDPRVADTDGDGLLDGEECNQAYFLTEMTLLWPDAKTHAEQLGGHLAVITSEKEHNQIMAAIPALKPASTNERPAMPWIGASDEAEEGTWVWVTGEAFDYTRWATGQPSNCGGGQHYARFWGGFNWNDEAKNCRIDSLVEFSSGLNPLNPDTDGDGLSDGDEVNLYGTCAQAVDSDMDGLNDYEEGILGTDPLHADIDEDGLSDAEELAVGTDPFVADTDGDGLADKEELDQMYFFAEMRMLWPDAKEYAEQLGGYLAVITSEEEHNQIMATISALKPASTNDQPAMPWIGASDVVEEGTWVWVTGEAFVYTRWAPGQPSNCGDGQHYARFWGGFNWNDEATDYRNDSLVEFSSGLNPLNPDSDGDGLSDGDEVNLYGSCALAVDSDLDGLSDSEEVSFGTSPVLADTDADGLSDPVELAGPTDPLNPDCDDDGLLDGAESRIIYVRRFLTWPEAKAEAEFRGGQLFTIASEEEMGEMDPLVELKQLKVDMPWIGASDVDHDGNWEWVDGSPFEYQNWYVDELTVHPDNFTGPEYYAAYFRGKTWDDNPLRHYASYVMEYPQSLDPFNPDCDGDGVSDGDEVNLYRSGPFTVDTDGDGLTDGEEVAAGLNPCEADSDRDGLLDPDEAGLGLDPLNPDTDGDGLSDGQELNVTKTNPLRVDSDANGVEDLTLSGIVPGTDVLKWLEPHISITWSNGVNGAGLLRVDDRASISYTITVSEPGMVQLRIQTDLGGDVVTADLAEPRLDVLLDGVPVCTALQPIPTASRPEYTLITPWLTTGTHTVRLNIAGGGTGEASFTIESIQVCSIDGVDVDQNGVQDWMESCMADAFDTDGDGVSDLDEVSLHGSDPLNADTDADGLNDGDEVAAGTDILNADTDGDGVKDGAEINEVLTNPLVPEFDGSVTPVDSVSGAEEVATAGEWVLDGTQLKSEGRRGWVEYTLTFPEQDVYGLNINAAHLWNPSSCNPVMPVDTSSLDISVDGIFVGSYPLVSADGTYVDVRAFLPALPAGEHTVRIFWENTSGSLALKIRELQLQQLGGPDADGDGVKDWVQASLDAMTGIDNVGQASSLSSLQFYVSPACLEGDARYVPLMSVSGGASASMTVKQGAGNRWFVDMPLNENNEETAIAVSFQNGAVELPVNVKWIPYNLIDHDGETLIIRKGDSLRLTCIDPARADDDLEKARGGQFSIHIADLGSLPSDLSLSSPNTRPIPCAFDEAGTYVVSGEYTKGNQTMPASITVRVIDWAFPEESLACMVGRERLWTVDLPQGAVLETDDTVSLDIVSCTPITNNLSQITCSLTAKTVNGEHVAVARICPGGAILDSTQLNPFWVQNATDGYFWTVERFEDSELWEVNSVVKNLPDSVDMQIKVIVGGVTLDDYALERWITNAAYDETGEYNFRLFHPNEAKSSTCHTFKVYQNGVFLGEAFSGKQNDVGEE